MPNQDGTGPQGRGPMTGRGMGRCSGGQGRGKGMGRGLGRRMGRCCEQLEEVEKKSESVDKK